MNPYETEPLVSVPLPSTVVQWLRDNSIGEIQDGQNRYEKEWRAMLDGAEPVKVVKGWRFVLHLTQGAARELAGELFERAEMEAKALSGLRNINPRTLRDAAEKIRALIPA